MAKYKNLADYRRQKFIKKAVRNGIFIVMLAVVLSIIIDAYEIFKTTNIDTVIGVNLNETALKEFPVIIKNEQILDFASFSNNVAVVTKSNIIMYNLNGKRVNTISHGYINPVVKESTQRILTYDRNGTKLRVDNENSKIGDLELQNTIITAEIAPTGEVVVVTTNDRYASEIQVYDSNLRNMLYRYYSTEHITSVDFSSDKKYIIANAITSANGILSCNLYRLDITTGEDAEIIFIDDILPLNISYGEKNYVKILGSDCIVTVDFDSGKQTRYSYKGNLQHFVNSPKGETILVNKSMYSNYSSVTVISGTGEIKSIKDVNDEIVDIYCNGSKIAILSRSEVFNFNMDLNLLHQFTLKKTMNSIVYGNSNIYVLGVDTMEEFEC